MSAVEKATQALRQIVALLDEDVEPDLDDYEHRAQQIYNIATAGLLADDPAAEAECTCYVTPEETWTRYGSAVEPGSQMEPNPNCPVHAQPAAAPSEDEPVVAELRAALTAHDEEDPQQCGHSSDPMCCPFENLPALAAWFTEVERERTRPVDLGPWAAPSEDVETRMSDAEGDAWDALHDDDAVICTCDGCNYYSPTYDGGGPCSLTVHIKAIQAAHDAQVRADERRTVLGGAADNIPAQVAVSAETRRRIGEWLRAMAEGGDGRE